MAIARHSELFENVRALCNPMVPPPEGLIERALQSMGFPQYRELVDLQLLKLGAFTGYESGMRLAALKVTMPVLMWQVHEDAAAPNPSDAKSTFHLLGCQKKKLIWIKGATQRFNDGHNWFGCDPQQVLDFLNKHMN